MNSHTLKISNSAEIPEPLEMDRTYRITLEGDCKDIKKSSNDDGSFTYTYNVKLLTAEIEDDLGQTLKIVDKKKQSQKLNAQIRIMAEEDGGDGNLAYEKYMTLLRHYWPSVKDYLDKLDSGL